MNVKLKSTVKHNGTRYEAGQTIEEIDETAGQILIDSGVAEAVGEAKTEVEVNDQEIEESQETPAVAPKVEEQKPLERMNKKELLAQAKERGIEVPEGTTNKEIVALLKGE